MDRQKEDQMTEQEEDSLAAVTGGNLSLSGMVEGGKLGAQGARQGARAFGKNTVIAGIRGAARGAMAGRKGLNEQIKHDIQLENYVRSAQKG